VKKHDNKYYTELYSINEEFNAAFVSEKEVYGVKQRRD
jgi:hypothetical protein